MNCSLPPSDRRTKHKQGGSRGRQTRASLSSQKNCSIAVGGGQASACFQLRISCCWASPSPRRDRSVSLYMCVCLCVCQASFLVSPYVACARPNRVVVSRLRSRCRSLACFSEYCCCSHLLDEILTSPLPLLPSLSCVAMTNPSHRRKRRPSLTLAGSLPSGLAWLTKGCR